MGRVLPILFNTEMVRAILGERKTATRRLIKKSQCVLLDKKEPSEFEREGLHAPFDGMTDAELIASTYKPPYQKGDILYVRETFRPLSKHPEAWFDYAADWSPEYFENSRNPNDCNGGKWKPSIHMPKKAARIWLMVTDVRVERLCDITEEQAVKEGLYKGWHQTKTSSCASTAKQAFMWVWNMTVKKGEHIFAANPWVWVIEFERCEKPEEE